MKTWLHLLTLALATSASAQTDVTCCASELAPASERPHAHLHRSLPAQAELYFRNETLNTNRPALVPVARGDLLSVDLGPRLEANLRNLRATPVWYESQPLAPAMWMSRQPQRAKAPLNPTSNYGCDLLTPLPDGWIERAREAGARQPAALDKSSDSR
jgi:hypothetical protein